MKQTQNFGDHSYLLVDGKEIFKVKADNFFFSLSHSNLSVKHN